MINGTFGLFIQNGYLKDTPESPFAKVLMKCKVLDGEFRLLPNQKTS